MLIVIRPCRSYSPLISSPHKLARYLAFERAVFVGEERTAPLDSGLALSDPSRFCDLRNVGLERLFRMTRAARHDAVIEGRLAAQGIRDAMVEFKFPDDKES